MYKVIAFLLLIATLVTLVSVDAYAADAGALPRFVFNLVACGVAASLAVLLLRRRR